MDEVAPEMVMVRRPPWQRIAKWVGVAIGGLALLLVLLVLGLNTSPGRRTVADLLGGYTMASGLKIKVGRIDGSLYGRMVLTDVRVSDTRGVFLTSPRVDLDWRPFAFARNHVDVRSATSRLVTLARAPALKPRDPNAPMLPDLDIDIGRLKIDRFVVGKPVTGSAHILGVEGMAHVADRRAQVTANVAALTGRDIAGGDRIALKLDAVPDADRLDIAAKLQAPVGGVVASMAKLTAPLDFAITGKGSWKNWQGRAIGLLGGQSFADLSLSANSGTFRLRGATHPGLYPGVSVVKAAARNNRNAEPTPASPLSSLTAPALQVAIDAKLDHRRVDTRLALRSDALAVAGQGLLDLGQSRFGQFRLDARLLSPGAIAPNLHGRDVAGSLVLDGGFGTPTVNYVIRAGSIGFGQTRVDDVYASGLARVDASHILVPIHARARRVSGLNAAAGGLLQNVTISGDLAISGRNILSDNLRIRSSRIDATAIVVANLSTGRYSGALNGRVNDYRVESFGILNLVTNAKLVTAPKGGFGITGRILARTSQIFNAGARSFLGGNAVMRTDISYDPSGIITFRNLRLSAPQFRVTAGSGRYDPKGGILFNANGYSTHYGPLFARVSGTTARPMVLLRAPHPGVGVGLADLEAQIHGTGSAYAVIAKGGTDYGPFTADLIVTPGAALAIDIRTARFAGVGIDGKLSQTAAGPFAGRLRFAGSGVTGTALLGAQGKVQRADIVARAYAAKIPGAVDFTIGRAIVNAQAIFYPGKPQILADAQIADLRYGEMVLSAARAKVNYVNGSGTAQALATGSNGVPFRIAANARLSPNLWVVAVQGQANRIGFRTGTPARIQTGGGKYHLLPTRIDFDNGSARVAGTYGHGITLQSRIDKLDLSVLNALIPDLGIGGAATGSIDFSQPSGGAFPQADARFNIAGFTRSSLTTVSAPVDIVFAGKLVPDGGDARALIKRGPTVVGRLVATMRPLPPGAGSWSTRLMAAPLSGGIRYNGPAGVLFSLAGPTHQQLSGAIAVAADFSGQVKAPRVNGVVRADKLTYENDTYGTRLTNMKLAGRFTSDRLDISQLQATAGEGSVQAQGSIGLAADSGFPIDIRVTLKNARLAKSDALGATATGTIAITHSKQDGGLIRGSLTIPDARYAIIRQGQAEVPELTGVRRKSDLVRASTQRAAAAPTGLFKLDLRISANNQLFLSGMGLESEWRMNLHVSGTSAAPRVVGRADVVRGTYSFAGKRFNIDTGTITFDGGPLADPQVSISASTTVESVTATINITGTGQYPRIAFTSTPALPQDEVLSRLLFGSSVTNLSATEAIQLAAALNSLRGAGGGLNPLGKLRSVVGIDRLRILGADQASGRGTALAAGKYITDNIYIEIITDARGFTATQLEVALAKGLSVLSQAGSFGGSNLSIRYKKDF